jgi:hypothetical protein
MTSWIYGTNILDYLFLSVSVKMSLKLNKGKENIPSLNASGKLVQNSIAIATTRNIFY